MREHRRRDTQRRKKKKGNEEERKMGLKRECPLLFSLPTRGKGKAVRVETLELHPAERKEKTPNFKEALRKRKQSLFENNLGNAAK
jgi:hypothetical protein